jgi:DNA-binding NtrC family response regulator
MKMAKVLVVEDDNLMRESTEETLRRAGYDVSAVVSAEEAIEVFQRGHFDVVLTDLRLPGMSGVELLDRVSAVSPDVPVVVITAYATVESAVDAMKRGAFDYVCKPFSADQLELVIARAAEHRRLVGENQLLREELRRISMPEFVVGNSRAMREIAEQIKRIASTDSTVFITGESGVGKEVVARAIHAASDRARGPFLCVNCAALSAGLLESELFGHEKGAFTGADRLRKGRFELANGGTLLLDEVSEIDLSLQAKLLRVLQEKKFERVGSSATIAVDVRVIATTNRDIHRAVREGKFREDLFFRLNVVPIHVPPLRERKEDIPPLVEHFVRMLSRKMGRKKSLPAVTLRVLMDYDWPGNVRELGNILERAFVLCPGEEISQEVIKGWLVGPGPEQKDPFPMLVGRRLEEVEKELIKVNLRVHGGNRQRTAQALGIAERTLREKIRRWKLV